MKPRKHRLEPGYRRLSKDVPPLFRTQRTTGDLWAGNNEVTALPQGCSPAAWLRVEGPSISTSSATAQG